MYARKDYYEQFLFVFGMNRISDIRSSISLPIVPTVRYLQEL
jgi:hypothetical protein